MNSWREMKRGFTLIELLVVVGIIGILATVIIINVSSASAKSRDAKIKSDLSEVHMAVNLYLSDVGSIEKLKCENYLGNLVSPTIATNNRCGSAAGFPGTFPPRLTDKEVRQLVNADNEPYLQSAPRHPVKNKNYTWAVDLDPVDRQGYLVRGDLSTQGLIFKCTYMNTGTLTNACFEEQGY